MKLHLLTVSGRVYRHLCPDIIQTRISAKYKTKISVSNADILEKSKIRFFCIIFSQYFWNMNITENICDHIVKYWQLSINLC